MDSKENDIPISKVDENDPFLDELNQGEILEEDLAEASDNEEQEMGSYNELPDLSEAEGSSFDIGNSLIVLMKDDKSPFLGKITEISTEENIKNLSARQKSERETFSLKITFEKVFLLFGSGTVGVKINDEDKGFIKMGQESTYNLSEGDHKIQFYSTLLKRRTFYPAKVINFTKDTCMVVSFKYNRAFGKIEITD